MRILKDLDRDIAGRDVLIVEDIIDSGLTLSWIRANLESRSPASVEVLTLLRKPEAVEMPVDVKYVGFDIPTDFVVGYGLDYNERYTATENPLGLNGYHLVSRGEKTPWRLKLRSASFNNVSVLSELLPGHLVADLVAVLGSMFFVVGDVDK